MCFCFNPLRLADDKQGRNLYETYGVSSFGYVVDSVAGKVFLWVADDLSVEVRNANPSQIKRQTTDYGSMFHVAHMRRDQDPTVDPEIQAIIDNYIHGNRSKERATFTRILLADLRKCHIGWLTYH